MCWCVCYLINRGNCFKASQSCIDRQGSHQMWLTDWLADSYRLYLPSIYFIASFQLWVPMRLLSWPVFFCPMSAVCLSKTLSNSLRICSVFFCCAAGVVAEAEAIDNRCCLISPWMLFLFYSQKIIVYPSPWGCMLLSVLLLEDMVHVKRTKTSKTTTGHGRKSRLSLATTKSKLLHCGRARLPDEDADTDADEGYTLSPNNLQAWIVPALFNKMYQSPHQQKRKQKQKTEKSSGTPTKEISFK